jgi:beta-N-acetylglucosaminidase/predicted ribosome-associated RNA-binding protein Tma20
VSNIKTSKLQLNSLLLITTVLLISLLLALNPNNANAASSSSWEYIYYDNVNLEGNGVYSGTTDTINYNWGNDLSPAPGIAPNTAFSAVYERKVTVDEGAYNLIARGNGGIRVYVDGHLYINKWNDTGERQIHTQPITLSSGEHTIRIEFRETAGEADLEFVLDDLLRDNRWFGVVYPNTTLSGDKGVLSGYSPQLPEINFDWGNTKSPAPGIAPNTAFSAVYQRKVTVDEGAYNLIARGNGGIRVYVDGHLYIDKWVDTGKRQIHTQPITLSSGEHTIRIEFKETAGEADLEFVLDDLLRDNRWFGVVYPNTTLSGDKGVLSGYSPQLPEINFDWGNTKSPAPGIAPNTAFSAVYQRKVTVDEGAYNLIARGNGGIRVYVDGQMYIDKWNDTGERQIHTQPVNLSAGEHTIRIEFKETAGAADLEFVLDNLMRDNRWYGVVFPNSDLSGNKGVLTGYSPQIPEIGFNWNTNNSPAPGIAADSDFSAIYQRYITVNSNEQKNLIVKTNGNFRVYIDGTLQIDQWNTLPSEISQKTINLPVGKHNVKIHYKNVSSNPNLHFKIVSGVNPWIGQVYTNNDFTGDSYITGYENNLDFNLGNSLSPVEGIKPNTAFSGVYTKKVTVTEGAYNLLVNANGGVRVLVDNEVYIDRLVDTGSNQSFQQSLYLAEGEHTIQIEYVEAAGESSLKFTLDNLTRSGYWYGVVFPNTNLTGKGNLVGYSPRIYNLDFDWGNDKSPSPSIPPNTAFSAIYQKSVNVENGSYYISAYANGGLQVYVDGEIVLDKWTDTGLNQVFQVPFHLSKGNHDIMIKFKETAGEANLTATFGKYNQGGNYFTTNYSYELSHMVNAQMNVNPQTDLTNGQGWQTASRNQVEYYTNPTNFAKGSKDYFQFLVLSQPFGLDSVDAKILNDNFLYNKGILTGRAQAFIQGANKYNVNELYLISHALLETGNGTSDLATGISRWIKRTPDGSVVKDSNGNPVVMDISPRKVYNMFGIGAFDSCPYDCGAQRAYDNGWFSPDTSIIEGAAFASSNYINNGQNTLYEMRWNPAHLNNNSYAYHQYASDIGWAVKQTTQMYNMYNALANSYALVFEVPHFVNQQSAPKGSKTWSGSTGNVVSYPTGIFGITDSGNIGLNLRDSPNGNLVGSIPTGSKITLLATNGTWYKVNYNNTIGWVHSDYVNNLNLLKVTATINLNVRKTPSTSGTLYSDQLTTGELVSAVLDSNNNLVTREADGYFWYQINFKGEKAWVSSGPLTDRNSWLIKID